MIPQQITASWVVRISLGTVVVVALLIALGLGLALSQPPGPPGPPPTLTPGTTWASLDQQTEGLVTALSMAKLTAGKSEQGVVQAEALEPCKQAVLLLRTQGASSDGRVTDIVLARCDELGHPIRH